MVNKDKLMETEQIFDFNGSSISRKSENVEKLNKRKEIFVVVTRSTGRKWQRIQRQGKVQSVGDCTSFLPHSGFHVSDSSWFLHTQAHTLTVACLTLRKLAPWEQSLFTAAVWFSCCSALKIAVFLFLTNLLINTKRKKRKNELL